MFSCISIAHPQLLYILSATQLESMNRGAGHEHDFLAYSTLPASKHCFSSDLDCVHGVLTQYLITHHLITH